MLVLLVVLARSPIVLLIQIPPVMQLRNVTIKFVCSQRYQVRLMEWIV